MAIRHWYDNFVYVWTGHDGHSHFVIMPMGYIALPVIAIVIVVGIVMRH
jgi:hypothetical protein